MKRSIELYIEDIKKSIEKIERYIKGIEFETFSKDELIIDGVVRNLEIIGEASRNIPARVKEENPDIPWEEIIGMRHKVVYEYFGVDMEILWETIKKDIPELKSKIDNFKL